MSFDNFFTAQLFSPTLSLSVWRAWGGTSEKRLKKKEKRRRRTRRQSIVDELDERNIFISHMTLLLLHRADERGKIAGDKVCNTSCLKREVTKGILDTLCTPCTERGGNLICDKQVRLSLLIEFMKRHKGGLSSLLLCHFLWSSHSPSVSATSYSWAALLSWWRSSKFNHIYSSSMRGRKLLLLHHYTVKLMYL